jgi:hypothetical protein
MTSLLKRITGSGAFVSYKYQLRWYLSVHVFIKLIFRQTCHCQWHVLVKTSLAVARFSKKRHWQWRVYTKTPLTVARLSRATGICVRPFVNLKFYFYHSYY